MTDQANSMKEHYVNRYGEPPMEDEKAIEKLHEIYGHLMKEGFNQSIKEGIAEYYRLLQARDLPAYYWLMEAFHVTSKKRQEKRTFAYVVGMIRTWMKYGFGHLPSEEETEIVNYFEEVTGHEVSNEARTVIQHMMGTYGIIKLTKAITNLNRDKNVPYLVALKLKDLLNENVAG